MDSLQQFRSFFIICSEDRARGSCARLHNSRRGFHISRRFISYAFGTKVHVRCRTAEKCQKMRSRFVTFVVSVPGWHTSLPLVTSEDVRTSRFEVPSQVFILSCLS